MGEAKRRRNTPIAAPKDWQPFPQEAAFGVVIMFGSATLRGGMTDYTLKSVIEGSAKLNDTDRKSIKDMILNGIKEDKHLDAEMGYCMLTGAALLAFSSEVGTVLRKAAEAQRTNMTYIITPLGTPNDYNWRLIAEPMGDNPAEVFQLTPEQASRVVDYATKALVIKDGKVPDSGHRTVH